MPDSTLLNDPTLLDRMWAKVDTSAGEDGCWIWTAALNDSGYGNILVGGRKGRRVRSHRAMYEILVGPIPPGYDLDHLCHNDSGCEGGNTCPHRACCNPRHLEPVTRKVNANRGRCGKYQNAKTHCPHGHEYTPENTFDNNGGRGCRTCRKTWSRKARENRKALING